MPGTQLVAGKRFSSEDYAPTTLIKSGPKGGIGGSSPFAMKQEMGFYRKDYTVSGIELQRKLNIVMPAFDNTGKLAASNFSMTVPYKDWLFEMKFANGIGNAIYFGRSNRDAQGNYLDKDFNGELIKQGSGIREQMQDNEWLTNDPCELLEITNWTGLSDCLYMYYYRVRSIYTNISWSFVPKIKKLTNIEIIEVKAKKYNI